MANPKQVAKLKEGVEAWNQWRRDNEEVKPDLSELDLYEEKLSGEHFSNGNVKEVATPFDVTMH